MKKELSIFNKLIIVITILCLILLISISFIILSVVLLNRTLAKEIIDICTVTFVSIFIVMNTTISLFIMIYKWKNTWCIENKLIWGLLSLIILSFIASLVFVIKGKKYYNQKNIDNKTPYYQFVEEPFDIKSIPTIDLDPTF